MKNHTGKFTGILLAVALIMPVFASAQTTGDVSSQIQTLLGQITSLQQQLHTLMGSIGSTTHQSNSDATTNTVNTVITNLPPIHLFGPFGTTTKPGPIDIPCINITRNLGVGSQGSDVTQVQGILAQNGFLSASSTTGFFGALTAKAVNDFGRYLGITGSTTQSASFNINDFFRSHCGSTNPSTNDGATTTWPTGGDKWHDNTPFLQGDPTIQSTGGGVGSQPHDSTSTHPCPQINNSSDAAAVALAVFEPHTILPLDMRPCSTQSFTPRVSSDPIVPSGSGITHPLIALPLPFSNLGSNNSGSTGNSSGGSTNGFGGGSNVGAGTDSNNVGGSGSSNSNSGGFGH